MASLMVSPAQLAPEELLPALLDISRKSQTAAQNAGSQILPVPFFSRTSPPVVNLASVLVGPSPKELDKAA